MKTVSLENVEKTEVNMEGACGAYKQVPVSKEDGAPNFSFRVFSLEPGGNTPYHSHPFEHVNYIISGKGALIDVDGNERPVQGGDFALVLPDEKHCYKNLSDDPFVMICAVPVEYE